MTLSTVALCLVYVELKNWAVGKIPSTEELKEAWSEWEVRCLVVLSLTLQLLLIVSAYVRQKYKGRFFPFVAAFVWSIYLLADWVATLAMTTILRGTFEKGNAVIVLWAPFLLWHLGNPANITAYSLEDNELWLRHLLGLVSNGAEAVYIYVRFRTAGAPNYGSLYYLDLMVVPLLIGGLLKYAERIVALRCASNEQLRSALYTEAESNHRTSKGKGMIRTGLYESAETGKAFIETKVMDQQVKFLREARVSFEIFRPLFLDLPFEISKEYHDHMVFLKEKTAEEAFRWVNVELQFLYDLFFTKNPIQHRFPKLNAILRGFYILSALSVLIAFSSTKNNINAVSKSDISRVDIAVTYLLLVGAVFLDAYAFVLHLWSNWTMTRFGIAGGKLHKFYNWLVASRLRSIKSKGGIPKIAQYDVLKDFSSMPSDSIFTGVINLIDRDKLQKKFAHITWVEVSHDLKEFIYSGLQKEHRGCNANGTSAFSVISKFLSDDHLDLVACMRPNGSDLERGKGESKQMPTGLTRAIFICHIATKLVYYDDLARRRPVDPSFCQISNVLSDYMVYLVLVYPSMLHEDFGKKTKEGFIPDKKRADVIKKESNKLASRFVTEDEQKLNPTAATMKFVAGMLHSDHDLEAFFEISNLDSPVNSMTETGERKTAPVLSTGADFAKQLQTLESESHWDNDEKWGFVCDVWMGMMIHAAKHCSWKEHVLVLRHGGELLTYVSLFMAHFGLSKNIDVHDYV